MAAELEQPTSLVDETNDLIPLVLGLCRVLDDLDVDTFQPCHGITDVRDEKLLIPALLGLLSVRRTLHRWIDPILRSAADSYEQVADVEAMRGLLR